MRPKTGTAAHKTSNAAELVCSNTFKSMDPASAHGILKNEMKKMGSLLIPLAEKNSVPAGKALAVDRDAFSADVTQALSEHPKINLIREEVKSFPASGIVICATGPLGSETLMKHLNEITSDSGDLYFYDAISPIVNADSLDFDHLFLADRYEYENTSGDYLNAPMTKVEYENFIKAINESEKVVPKDFEESKVFEACMPVEMAAKRGLDTLRFGPMKPVGLKDPKTGRRPYAVVQLRKENKNGTSWNLVGFQTRMKYPEQKRVFGMIAALKNAEYFRLGSIHRNTYVNSPKILNADLSLKAEPRIFLAGQITGVEGYTESAACGLLAAQAVVSRLQNIKHTAPPSNCAMGALLNFILMGSATGNFQPSNINFGLFPPIDLGDGLRKKISRVEKRQKISERAANAMDGWIKELE